MSAGLPLVSSMRVMLGSVSYKHLPGQSLAHGHPAGTGSIYLFLWCSSALGRCKRDKRSS